MSAADAPSDAVAPAPAPAPSAPDAPSPAESALAAWRDSESAGLSADERAWCSRRTIARYCAARNNDVEAATTMLRETVEWRRTIKRPLRCEPCEADKGAHCFLPLGLSESGTLVLYICPARAAQSNVEDAISHVVATLESCFSHPRSDNRWIVVMDFSGFGLTHALQVRLGSHFSSFFSRHLPETLHYFLLLNTPTLFQMLRSLIEPFADARTMAKVKSIDGVGDGLREQLVTLGVPARIARWVQDALEREPKPNNLPPLPPGAAELAVPGAAMEEAAE